MRNEAKSSSIIAPKRKKTANDGLGSVVAEYRHNKDGSACGPYYYWYRYENGTRTKTYLSRAEGARKQAQLAEIRAIEAATTTLMEQIAANHKPNDETATPVTNPTGRYWHGSDLRARRHFPVEERDRILFNLNTAEIHADLGFPISEDDYVVLLARIRSELARLSQQGVEWKDGATLDMDLSGLPSRHTLMNQNKANDNI